MVQGIPIEKSTTSKEEENRKQTWSERKRPNGNGERRHRAVDLPGSSTYRRGEETDNSRSMGDNN